MTNDEAGPKLATINRRSKGEGKWPDQAGRHRVSVEGCNDFCKRANCR